MIPSKKLPKISIEKTLLLSSVLWGICLYLFGIHIKGPFIFGDEQVYFSFARTISKWNNINTYTQYGPLYPFFIAPFFFLKNIIQSYDFIKILNILFFISAVIPSYLLAKKLFKNSFLRIILPTLVLITPFGSFVYLVWAEPL
ncbi:MAG: hypothetical protein JO131_00620, partial [Gammaproteobacteria bacterium]|nr:hypothetical protein [Gammaproteobacteria bacterium]